MPPKPARKKRAATAVSVTELEPTATSLPPSPASCSTTFAFFENVTIAPGQAHDSGTAKSVDCYQWLHVWVLARHPQNRAMDRISVELVFELTGKMGATGLANLGNPYTPGVIPRSLLAKSGANIFGGFVIRSPIIGPGVRAIVINNGTTTYNFSVWGYATH